MPIRVSGKIDKTLMLQMTRQGKTNREIADFFECNINAVGAMKRRIKRQMAIMPELVQQSELFHDDLTSLSQLAKTDKAIMEELDRARRLITREDASIREREALEDAVKTDPYNYELVQQLKEKGHINYATILKIQANLVYISAEERKLIELRLKIAETLYSATMMARFQEEVLVAIGKVSIPVRDAIIKELKQYRSLKGLVQIKK